MLKPILAITGKPGLYKIVAHSTKNLIVEDLNDKKRFPVSMRDRIVSLGDIAIYTTSEDKPLGEILDMIYEFQKGEPIDVKELQKNGELHKKLDEIVPDNDAERIRDNDIKKMFQWYNILINNGMTKFFEESEKISESEGSDKISETENSVNTEDNKDKE